MSATSPVLRAGRPQPIERRRHRRVAVALDGRYMLEDRREFGCSTVDMSPGGVRLRAPERGIMFGRVVVYLDVIGRIEGVVCRCTDDGFAARLENTAAKRERLAEQLTWLANRDLMGVAEGRQHERIVPLRRRSTIVLPGGDQREVEIVDISRSGVALNTDAPLEIGSLATIGHTSGRVVRTFSGGIALEFLRLFPVERFDEDIVL